MYRISFNLEPITYMVHFQVDEDSPTIRASELKPLLDKFLTRMLDEKTQLGSLSDFDDSKYVLKNPSDEKDDVKHFDYQVRITQDLDKYKQLPDKKKPGNGRLVATKNKDGFEFFFKNKDGSYKFKKVLTYPEVTFISQHKPLLQWIKAVFPSFIASSHFGFRKGKAYGQFFVTHCNNISCPEHKEEHFEYIKSTYSKGPNQIILIRKLRKSFVDYSDIEQRISDFNGQFRKDKLKSHFRVKMGDASYYRGLLGKHESLGKYTKIEHGVIKRFANPVKYYISPNYDGVLIIVDTNSIRNLLKEGSAERFSFTTSDGREERKSLPILTEEELKEFFNYLDKELKKTNL